MTSEIFGISRHRLGTDGQGITTLVAFTGCRLHCRYCLNPQCHGLSPDADGKPHATTAQRMSPEMLYRKVCIDDLYFQATHGGICFGGGEPALQAPFIRSFADLCGRKWRITLETSLHAPRALWSTLVDAVDEWIVDVKDMTPPIYIRSTPARIRSSGLTSHGWRCMCRRSVSVSRFLTSRSSTPMPTYD